jgi:peptidoglycan/xylan/chitin deacetylase (PgdA/CDA1 family)
MVLTCSAVIGFNAAADPFGVFGDHLFDWYAFDMTNNPRVAKIAYLDERSGAYDSYIIGCSKTASFSAERLNEYYGDAAFYNMIMYGGDMYDIKKTAEYVILQYSPKNIIIALGLEETTRYNYNDEGIKNELHAKTDGEPLLPFYAKYALLNPGYGLDKLSAMADRSLLPGATDVFVPESGVYNKTRRDAESIGDLEEFRRNNPAFEYDLTDKTMDFSDQAVSDVAEIKRLCDERGVDFKLVMMPIYYKEMNNYRYDELLRYWEALADVTEFWDFSGYSSISYDERYFYDAYHFRNSVGDAVLARIFGDTRRYVPADLGQLTTKENADVRAADVFTDKGAPDPSLYTKELPILLYHDLSESTDGAAVTPESFGRDMLALKENGYTAVSFADVRDYAERGTELPEKPVVISFDDGYRSNYLFAYEILKEFGMKGVVNMIGVSVGKSTYKDTSQPIIPHFSYAEAREMYASGVMDFQSHSYAMHDSLPLEDPQTFRNGVLPKKGEGEREYIEVFRADVLQSKTEAEKNIGADVFVYAYPMGFYSELTEALLIETGFSVTLSIEPGINCLIKGIPQSLLAMKRINRTTESKDIIETLAEFSE